MHPELLISDQRILEFIDSLLDRDKVSSQKEFCENVGINRMALSNIRNGKQSFTVAHISNICTKYNVNANWIFGFEKKVFRK